MTTATQSTTALATVRGLTDKQIQTRIDLNRKAGYGLEKAGPPQLNLIFLYCQKYQLLPGDDVTIYEGKPWLTLLGTVKLMRRHDEYRGFDCKPLSAAAKTEWGYDPEDIVVECQIRTKTWGTISARGKVSKEEIAGIKIEGRRLNYVASIHPVEMAEKRAIQRAERLAFGADAMIDEDEIETVARTVIEMRNDPERVDRLAAEHDRVFVSDQDWDRNADPPSTATNTLGQTVDTQSGEGLEEASDPSTTTEAAKAEATKQRPVIGAWQRNRQLVAEANKRHLTGVPVLPSKSGDDVVVEANRVLEERIRNYDLDQQALAQSQETF